MSLFSVHKCYKRGPIFLGTVVMSTLYFQMLCEDNTDWAFLLWRLKQIFCSNSTGLASVLNFKGTTVESTEILYQGKKSISSSHDLFFRSKFRHYFHMFPPPGMWFCTFLHLPRKFQFAVKVSICRENWLMHVIFSQCDFTSPRQSKNENSSVMMASSAWLPCANPLVACAQNKSCVLWLAPKINVAWDPNRELAHMLS